MRKLIINDVFYTFYTDKEFLLFARKFYRENEAANPYPSTIHWLPENIQQATEYLVEYCGIEITEL